MTSDAALLEGMAISREAVLAQPRVTPMLRLYVGNRAKVLRYLRASSDPDARKILIQLERLPQGISTRTVALETLACLAGISSARIGQIVMYEAGQEGTLLAHSALPRVIASTVEDAQGMNKRTTKAREFLFKHTGFLPMPRTQVTNYFGRTQVDARQATVNVAVLKPIEEGVRRMTDRFNAALPAPPLGVPALDVPVEECDDDDE